MTMRPALEVVNRVEHLDEVLNRFEHLAVAVSGGVDSTTLAAYAHERGVGLTAVHAVSPAVPPAATDRVRRLAADRGWDLVVTGTGEFADERYLTNPVDRCYFCKTNLYDRMRTLTPYRLASGANTDDLGDYRPGLRAARERDVVHPYVEAGMGKPEVRRLARALGLTDLAELPAQPCLASRVETGIAIDAGDLALVDEVEDAVRRVVGGAVAVRCRITHGGVALELDAAAAPEARAQATAVVADRCRTEGRHFLGVRPYVMGAAFLHPKGGR